MQKKKYFFVLKKSPHKMFQSKREKRFTTTFMWHEQLGII